MNRIFLLSPKYLFLLVAGMVVCSSCLSDTLSKKEEPGSQSQPVPPDGILEAVTWNIEWYGSPSHGPGDEDLQTANVLTVMDSLRADFYALQEIYSQEALDNILAGLNGYKGFVAEHIDWIQKTAFIYNTQTIDSISAGAITSGQNEYDWAGRFPLFFSFSYSYRNTSIPIYAIVIHAKANTGNSSEKEEAYNRRRRAADSLYAYLQNEQPDKHIILLGDFNDDVDVSIYNDSSPSPYHVFLADTASFKAVTESISKLGQSSYISGSYSDLIDHMIISDELFAHFNSSSEEIYFEAGDFIDNYVTTTSDHLPVWATFDIIKPKQYAAGQAQYPSGDAPSGE